MPNEVGVAHLGAIISTLFLLYAGVSLPLLIIFTAPGISASSILGYEPLSTEIIRMLTGSNRAYNRDAIFHRGPLQPGG